MAANAGKDGAAGQAVGEFADGVEVGGAVVALDGLRLEVITQTEVYGEASGKLPIVLEVAADGMGDLAFAQVGGDAGAADGAHQVRRIGASGAGRREGVAG